MYVGVKKNGMNLPNIFYINPYSLTLEYGKELNKHIECFPKKSWIVVTDHDVQFLTPNAGRLISNAIVKYPDTSIFTCQVNRLGQAKRCHNMEISDNDQIKHHTNIAIDLERKLGYECEEVDGHLAGFFWCFPRRVWEDNKFDNLKIVDKTQTDHLQSFDVRWTNKIQGAKRMITGLYVFHAYRINKHLWETDHLEI